MRWIMVLTLVVGVLGGCKSGELGYKCEKNEDCKDGLECKEKPGACGPVNEHVKAVETAANEICACEAADCLAGKRKAIGEKVRDAADTKLTKGEFERIKKAMDRSKKCFRETLGKKGKKGKGG